VSELTLEAPTQTLDLKAPDPVAVVSTKEAAGGLVPVDEAKKPKLDAKVEEFVNALVAAPANSPQFGEQAAAIAAMGQREIRELAGQSNRFLDRPVKAMEDGVGIQLAELRRVVEDLDPSEGMKPRKLLGFIPFGGKLTAYFDRYKSAQSHISGILTALSSGKETLIKDNIAVDTERANLWNAMGRLEQMIYIAKALDKALEERALDLDSTDPIKSKAIRESALFEVRQRTQDLLTQMAVSVQGYLALDLVKKNNVELIKGVDRASTTTVAALRTAVTVAQALNNQRLVLNQIGALNTTTAGIIDSTGALLKTSTAQIHEQAASSTIPVETLKRAFQNIYDTMDAIDTFKIKSLDSMKTTVEALSGEVDKSRGYIARAQGAQGTLTSDRATTTLSLD
jgi:uncharacterized protein YaaN involved in tellurite resistance